MRDIKFRAWDKQNEEFMEVGRLYQEDNIYCVEEHPDVGDAYGFVEKDIVLMQYTGLKDKNGTEIYEGDILTSYTHEVGKVIFSEGAFFLDYGDAHDFLFECTDWEIIGNIYEHKHLLEETK